MRKQTKIVALAAVLALGASFTSMAVTYDWRMESDGWYCYDEDGEAYDEEWVESYGNKYWVDDEGKMVTSCWVEDGDYTYYVGSDGKKTVSDWKFTFAEDEEDDEDAEEAWFYFNSKGRLETNKRISWNGNYYYVDKDGKMLTGWVDYVKGKEVKAADKGVTDIENLIYVAEDGKRVANEWYYGFEAGLTDDEIAELEDDKQVYYWINKDGKVATGKMADINGETYFFGEDGIMLYGWVVNTDAENGEYAKAEALLSTYDGASVYFCGSKDQGWAKKDRWIKEANSKEFWDKDEDTSTYWFYLSKSGKVFVPDVEATDSNASVYLVNAKAATFNGVTGEITASATNAHNAELKTIDGDTYLFDANGQMLKGLQFVDEKLNYFGTANEGQRKLGSIMVADTFEDEYELTFAKKDSKVKVGSPANAEYVKYEALNGNVDGYLYENGMIQKSSEKGVYDVVTVNDLSYLVNYKGKVQTDMDDKYELESGKEIVLKDVYAFENPTENENSVKYGAIKAKK